MVAATTTGRVAVFDGHNDVLSALLLPGPGRERDFFVRGGTGHIDAPRAREGGFAGGLFAMFVPDQEGAEIPALTVSRPLEPSIDHERASQLTVAMMALLERLEREAPDQLHIARDAADLRLSVTEGLITAVMHIEGAEAIDARLHRLEALYERGLRSVGPVWSRANAFAEGVPLRFPSSPDTGPGLTRAGRELVHACNELGIMVDVSHLNEQGFWDVARTSRAPIVATHSNAHALCPISRNLTDAQLDAIRDSDGLVGVNFGVCFLRDDGGMDTDTPVASIVAHVEYLVERLGIDRVGFGSDFDGAPIPDELGDVSRLQDLIGALRGAGFDETALRKLGHENWLRVLETTWRRA